jgi:hypothetical protein
MHESKTLVQIIAANPEFRTTQIPSPQTDRVVWIFIHGYLYHREDVCQSIGSLIFLHGYLYNENAKTEVISNSILVIYGLFCNMKILI